MYVRWAVCCTLQIELKCVETSFLSLATTKSSSPALLTGELVENAVLCAQKENHSVRGPRQGMVGIPEESNAIDGTRPAVEGA